MTDGTPSVFFFFLGLKDHFLPRYKREKQNEYLIPSPSYRLASLSRFSLTTERTQSRTSSASLRSMK